MRNLRIDHPGTPIVIAGDLNTQGEEAEILLRRLGLFQARPSDENSFYSRKNPEGLHSWIDHIASTEIPGPLENILDAEYISDHVPIVTRIAISPKLCDRGRVRKRIQHVVKADITQAEVQRVLRNS